MKLVRTYFRSVDRDTGVVWCETRDPYEVLARSEGRDVEYQRLDVYEHDHGWQAWNTKPRSAKQRRKDGTG